MKETPLLKRRRVWRLSLLAAGLALFPACGALDGPYEIRVPPPEEGSLALDLLPAGNAAEALDDPPIPLTTLASAEDWAAQKFEDGSTLTILRFSSVDGALKATEEIYDESEANWKRRVRRDDYSWLTLRGDGRYRFGWSNQTWVFLVDASSKSDAETIILSTGFALDRED